MYIRIELDGITFHGVSNISPTAIKKAEKKCLDFLRKIGKVNYKSIGGTKDTITFYVDLTEEEVDNLEQITMNDRAYV